MLFATQTFSFAVSVLIAFHRDVDVFNYFGAVGLAVNGGCVVADT